MSVYFKPTTNNQDPREVWKQRNPPIADPSSERVRALLKIVTENPQNVLPQLEELGITPNTIIGSGLPQKDSFLTVQVARHQLEQIRKLPFVISIEHNRVIGPTDSH